jgi:SAM-dependent methyltransferase
MLRTVLRHFPRTKAALSKLRTAARFHRVPPDQIERVSDQLSGSWLEASIPAQQRRAIELELAAYKSGQASPVFDGLVEILLRNIPEVTGRSLLEIGCSSGYYSEILESRKVGVVYHGCDFSPAFVEMAREHYPSLDFKVENATQLGYSAAAFDIVVSGCCLLHIPEYEKAIAEAARVSREFVIFHRTPVLHLSGPTFYTKKGYGQEMLEIHFNEQSLVRLFTAHGMAVIDVNAHKLMPEPGHAEPLIYKTYLCRKVN